MRELSIEIVEPTLVLTTIEIISIFKSVLIDCANIDLDELEVYPIIKYSNNRLHITLDMDLLRTRRKSFILSMRKNRTR